MKTSNTAFVANFQCVPAGPQRRHACAATKLGAAPRMSAAPRMGTARRVAGLAAAALLLVVPSPGNALMDRDVLVFDHDQGLAGADFSNREDLVGAIFSKANAKGANFSKANLTNAQLDDTILIEAVLDGADCTNVLATKAKFQKSSLRDVNFTNANLIASVLDRADITGADFTDALLEPATMKKLCARASGTNSQTGVETRYVSNPGPLQGFVIRDLKWSLVELTLLVCSCIGRVLAAMAKCISDRQGILILPGPRRVGI